MDIYEASEFIENEWPDLSGPSEMFAVAGIVGNEAIASELVAQCGSRAACTGYSPKALAELYVSIKKLLGVSVHSSYLLSAVRSAMEAKFHDSVYGHLSTPDDKRGQWTMRGDARPKGQRF